MRKRYIAATIGMVGMGVATNLVLQRKKRSKFTDDYSLQGHILEEAGIPDQLKNEDLAQLENANMVSEGSQYGVNYYNEVKEAEHHENLQ